MYVHANSYSSQSIVHRNVPAHTLPSYNSQAQPQHHYAPTHPPNLLPSTQAKHICHSTCPYTLNHILSPMSPASLRIYTFKQPPPPTPAKQEATLPAQDSPYKPKPSHTDRHAYCFQTPKQDYVRTHPHSRLPSSQAKQDVTALVRTRQPV